MRNIGEELQFHFVELPHFLAFKPFQFQLIEQAQTPDPVLVNQIKGSSQNQNIQDVCPDGIPGSRQNMHLQFGNITLPYSFVVGCPNFEYIISCGQARVGGIPAVGAGVLPLLIGSFQFIGIVYFFCSSETGRDKFKGKVINKVRDGDGIESAGHG